MTLMLLALSSSGVGLMGINTDNPPSCPLLAALNRADSAPSWRVREVRVEREQQSNILTTNLICF
jgi:hypothetical protein